MLIGFPWFEPDDYQALRKLFSDGDRLPGTFSEWRIQAITAFRLFEEQNLPVMRVRIEPKEFQFWCWEHGLPPDYRARQAFAVERVRYTVQAESVPALRQFRGEQSDDGVRTKTH